VIWRGFCLLGAPPAALRPASPMRLDAYQRHQYPCHGYTLRGRCFGRLLQEWRSH
jgi:hypothetical protein